MLLNLAYAPGESGMVHAAIISGSGPAAWFREISRWDLQPEEMDWYVLPSSRQMPDAGGLLVVFKDPSKVKDIEFLEGYVEIAPKLLIPLHARITPAVSPEEWNQLLIWNLQLLHPVLGFIGFETTDRIDPSALLSIPAEKCTDWSFANTGLPARKELFHIHVLQPSSEKLIETLKKDIGQKPLENILEKEKARSFLGKLFDRIALMALRLVAWLFFGFLRIVSIPVSRQAAGDNSGREGLFDKMGRWLNRNIDDLQKKRDTEMERLLKMFEQNEREALEYAIPLNSPYLNRGETTTGGSSRLVRRSANYIPFGLSGGAAAEIWNIDNYRESLRQKYHAAAKKEIEQKDFRRAAYVYAHLLGDYHSAANCLEQGGLFREAAALHKDHLKNKRAAAACLERGGLYREAVDLYAELGMHEQAGDVYQKIDEPEQAMAYYEKYVAANIGTHGYLDAARVLDEKMQQTDRANQALLEGWRSNYQSNQCLKRYFDLAIRDKKDIANEITAVYDGETPASKQKAFLEVLQYVKTQNDDGSADEAMQDLAYNIINKHAESGDLSLLSSLPGFVPKDKLLKGDSQRFAAKRMVLPFSQRGRRSFTVDPLIRWSKAIRSGDQVLLLGERNGFLQLARLNEDGAVDYYSWAHEIPKHCRFTFIHSDILTTTVLLQSSDEMVLENKLLPKTKHFRQALKLAAPGWLQKRSFTTAITDQEEIVTVNRADDQLMLSYHNIDGEFQRSVPCVDGTHGLGNTLLYAGDLFFSYEGKTLMTITRKGFINNYDLGSGIRLLAASTLTRRPKIIVSTNKGCSLFEVDQQLYQRPGIFLPEFTPLIINHLSGDLFIMAETKKVLIVSAADSTLTVMQEFNFPTPILTVLPASGGKNSLMVIDRNGNVTVDFYERPE